MPSPAGGIVGLHGAAGSSRNARLRRHKRIEVILMTIWKLTFCNNLNDFRKPEKGR